MVGCYEHGNETSGSFISQAFQEGLPDGIA